MLGTSLFRSGVSPVSAALSRPLSSVMSTLRPITASSTLPRALAASVSSSGTASPDSRSWLGLAALAVAGVTLSASTTLVTAEEAASVAADPHTESGKLVEGLPDYSLATVREHKTKETGIWVTFRDGVYDITDFVEGHPGGEKILMAAGGSLEPFWGLYAVHKESEEAAGYLKDLRIGNICEADRLARDAAPAVVTDDPFGREPLRHPALKVNSMKPFNAETPKQLLTDNYITPNELFFTRNHLPVPHLSTKDYRLEITGDGIDGITLTLDQLKTLFRKHSIVATLQCGGNRRAEMNEAKSVKGLGWTGGAISNAKWSGARLRDVLLAAGMPQSGSSVRHVQFEGADQDESGTPYGASIPLAKALNFDGDVLLAYEMNDEPIPLDHGFPVRVVVPGHVGSRNVKWVSKIVTSDKESPSFWQQNDYKFLAPSVDWSGASKAMAETPSIQEMPVQSGIVSPLTGETISVVKDKSGQYVADVSGYAWSGGGRAVMRVEVTADEGKTWVVADLTNEAAQATHKSWAWTLWDARVPVPVDPKTGKPPSTVQLAAKAVDSSLNTQPESLTSIWNLRGLACNAWPRVEVTVESE